MDEKLEQMTKQDLIKVIANMHDVVQDWGNGWGLSDAAALQMIDIGDLCRSECARNNNWEINFKPA